MVADPLPAPGPAPAASEWSSGSMLYVGGRWPPYSGLGQGPDVARRAIPAAARAVGAARSPERQRELPHRPSRRVCRPSVSPSPRLTRSAAVPDRGRSAPDSPFHQSVIHCASLTGPRSACNGGLFLRSRTHSTMTWSVPAAMKNMAMPDGRPLARPAVTADTPAADKIIAHR